MAEINADREATLQVKAQRLSEAWTHGFAPLFDNLQAASDASLEAAFDATDMLLFYATLAGDGAADRWLDRLADIASELRQRDAGGVEQTAKVFAHLLTLRRFDEARALREANPALHVLAVPTLRFAEDFQGNAPAAMTRQADGAWHVENIALADVGMVAVIGCPTSAKAVAAIAKDPLLVEKLERVGVVWLADASAMSAAAGWNAALPDQPMRVAWRNGAWPGIAFDSMPAFFFLQEGRVVAYDRQGWGDGPMQSSLHASLDRLH
ncbi:hypothetical protein AB4059_12125 [Lysobacter sp. 2RAF19]